MQPDYVTIWPDDEKSVDTDSKCRFTWRPGSKTLGVEPKATPELLGELAATGFIDGLCAIKIGEWAKAMTGLPPLPPAVAESLQSLTVRSTKLRDWSGVYALPQLEELDVEVDEIPDGISALTSLRRLRIKSKRLKALPSDLGELSELKHLAIVSAPITELPEGLVALEELSLSGTKKLKQLPDSLGANGTLRLLRSDSAPLKQLPPTVWEGEALEELAVAGSKLSKVGARIRWPVLRVLELSGGTFKKWPSEFSAPQLQKVKIEGKHQTLPDLFTPTLADLFVNAPLASVDPRLAELAKVRMQCSKAAYAALSDAEREAFGTKLKGTW